MSLCRQLSNSKNLLYRVGLILAISLTGILWVQSEEPSGGSGETAVEITEVENSSKLRLAFRSDVPGNFCPEYSTDFGASWIPLHNFTHHYNDGLNVCYVELPDHQSTAILVRVLRINEILRPTFYPQHPTLCPVYLTSCPGTPTQCISTFPTVCPETATATACPRIPTECIHRWTTCPQEETRCPARPTACSSFEHPTICPVQSTTCPRDPTECFAYETVCPTDSTACAHHPTLCPVSSSETECPAQWTECPAADTYCPSVATECPRTHTECPADPTICAPETTVCPRVITECLQYPTRCPVEPTVCPEQWNYTVCPAYATACPLAQTRCPRMFTLCPSSVAATECPIALTQCPSAETQCPIDQTACPRIATQCPVAETECPSAQVQTECPAVPTACPGEETACPVDQTTCPHIPTQCADLSVGLVGHYKLDGNGDDSSGNDHHGTPQGGVSFVNDAERGLAADFDGVDGVIDMGDVVDFEILDGSMSFSAWFKTSYAGPLYQNLFSSMKSQPNYDGYQLFMYPSTACDPHTLAWNVNYDWGNEDSLLAAAETSINDGTWHHVCAVVDREAETTHLYVDGLEDNGGNGCGGWPVLDSTGYGSSDSGALPFLVGNRNNHSRFWHGQMDDMRIYNRALSQAEVTALMKLP